MFCKLVDDIMFGIENLLYELLDLPFERDIPQQFKNTQSDSLIIGVDVIEKSYVNFLLSNKFPTLFYGSDINEKVCDYPSSDWLYFHKSVQHFKQETSLLSLTDECFDDSIELGKIE